MYRLRTNEKQHNRLREDHEWGRNTESVLHVLEKEGCKQDLLEKRVGNII